MTAFSIATGSTLVMAALLVAPAGAFAEQRKDAPASAPRQLVPAQPRPLPQAQTVPMTPAVAVAQAAPGTPLAAPDEVNDPLEIPNRFIFSANWALDVVLLRPAAAVYKTVLPNSVQNGARNLVSNLGEPVTALNEALQGRPSRAGQTLLRFAINSTVGMLGLADVAAYWGIPGTQEDFGQTLGTWGADSGVYLVLPLVGPSNIRDATGLGVDYLADPWHYAFNAWDVEYLSYVRVGLSAIDGRARTLDLLDDIERNSVDYYATLRTLYEQRRAAQIRNHQSDGSSTLNPLPITLD